jgi:hypothetical protein
MKPVKGIDVALFDSAATALMADTLSTAHVKQVENSFIII